MVHFLFDEKESVTIPYLVSANVYPRQQKSSEIAMPIDLSQFETVRAPLGYKVMGRSGDMATDANVG